MKKIILISLLTIVMALAYFTKPDDKTCKELAVKGVWGNVMPDKYRSPRFYSQFMNLYAGDITVDDWVLFKVIKYKLALDKRLVIVGVFKGILFLNH